MRLRSRDPQPVRRKSRPLGSFEDRFWRPVSADERRRLLDGAKAYERRNRKAGRRNGPLGHIAIEVLTYFLNVVDDDDGRLEVSIDTLKIRLKRCRQSICDALASLQRCGFLTAVRRFRYLSDRRGPGPRVEQACNAYRVKMPADLTPGEKAPDTYAERQAKRRAAAWRRWVASPAGQEQARRDQVLFDLVQAELDLAAAAGAVDDGNEI